MAAIGLLLLACSKPEETNVPERPERESASPQQPSDAATKLAEGLHSTGDNQWQAVGTLKFSDLEGGFWLLAKTTGQGKAGKTIVVIANGKTFEQTLKVLEGKRVIVSGKKLDSLSIRMAGPEMEIDSVRLAK